MLVNIKQVGVKWMEPGFFFFFFPVTEQKTMCTNWKVLPEQEKIFILRLTET